MGGVCLIIVAWGATPAAIANSVVWRAAALPASFVVPSPVGPTVVAAAAVSLVIAMCYALAPPQRLRHELPTIALSVVKLAYGAYALYALHHPTHRVLLWAVPLPFLWLVVARADTDDTPSLEARFPRVFLCLLAAFQALQAYPVGGSQARWSVLLIIPVVAICIGDAGRTLVDVGGRHLQRSPHWRVPPWSRPLSTVLILGCLLAWYHQRANVPALRAFYAYEAPVALPGATRLRLLPAQLEVIRWAVANLKADCDGFVGLPGAASFYFWTGIPPPAIMNNAWILNLDDAAQRAIVATMRTYERPCVLHDAGALRFWTMGGAPDRNKPLVRYIQTEYRRVKSSGRYALLQKAPRRIRPPGPRRVSE
jgi:hypothetical protein